MELDIIDKTFIFYAGGLLNYKKENEPLYLKSQLGHKIISNIENKFRSKVEEVNSDNNVIEIYLKTSNKCNLRCSYCFRKVQEIPFNIEYIEKFVNNVIHKYKCKKVRLDLTGDSEPLMEIEKLQQIIDTCNNIGEKENVEFIYALNSNGTVINSKILNFLYSNSILFGFTVEGFSLKNHRRIYSDGAVAQDDVIKNINKYKLYKNNLFGTSMTLTSEHEDFVVEYKNLLNICNAISMRIVNTFDELGVVKENLEDWKRKYKELTIYLLEQLKEKKYENFIPILRSRDFFGTYIKAVLFNVKRNQACLGGYKQVFLNYTGDIYVCSWGYKDNKYKIGEKLSLTDERLNYYEHYTVDTDRKCKDCDVRYICGGECHIIRGENKDDDLEPWCELKKYLIGLSCYIVDWLRVNDIDGMNKIKELISTNNYVEDSEPYIKVLKELFRINKISKSANVIKNEVESIDNGPILKDFINYLKQNNFSVHLVDDCNEDFNRYTYILHRIIGNYNYYEIVKVKEDLPDDYLSNIIIQVMNN